MQDLSNENVIHIKKNGIEYLQFRKLLEFENLKHCYTLKSNNMDFRAYHDGTKEEQQIMLDNYKKICEQVEIDYEEIIKPKQTHTDVVETIKRRSMEKPDIYTNNYADVDGLVTNYNDIALATSNADCILMMLYDSKKNVIANVHSGWKGTAQKIIANCIKKMKEDFLCNPEDIICCMCPSIRVCHFEVDEDVKNIFEENFKYTNRLSEIIKRGEIKEDKQKYYIDTILINKILLEEAGLLKKNIIDSGICSVCESELVHSKRAEGDNFNLATAIIEMK